MRHRRDHWNALLTLFSKQAELLQYHDASSLRIQDGFRNTDR